MINIMHNKVEMKLIEYLSAFSVPSCLGLVVSSTISSLSLSPNLYVLPHKYTNPSKELNSDYTSNRTNDLDHNIQQDCLYEFIVVYFALHSIFCQ